MDFITNVRLSIKDISDINNDALIRTSNNDSILKIINPDSRVFQIGYNILIDSKGEGNFEEYQIKDMAFHILSDAIPSDDGIPYSYHLHIDVKAI